MTPKEQAISMLAQGLSTSVVAAICGVTESYISQLRSEEDVVAKMAALKADASSEAAARPQDAAFDTTLESAEHMALDRISKNLPFANMGQALAAFRILNGARRRKDGVLPSAAAQALTLNVNLTLPTTTIPHFVTNRQNEIVEVEGRTLVTAEPKSLDSMLAERAQAKALPLAQSQVLERAAEKLDGLQALRSTVAPARRIPSSSPAAISPDML